MSNQSPHRGSLPVSALSPADFASAPEPDEDGNDAEMGDLAEAAAWLPIPPGTPPELARLRGRQRHALYELMDGGTHASAARLAGVNRRTVHRWVHQDPVFRAALEGWRRSEIQTAEDRPSRRPINVPVESHLAHLSGIRRHIRPVHATTGSGVTDACKSVPRASP